MKSLREYVAPAVIAVALMVATTVVAVQTQETKHLTTGTRRVLCVGIIGNTTNPARDDPTIISECAQVDIHRADYPPTEGG